MTEKSSKSSNEFNNEVVTQPRRIFPEDHEALRVLAFKKNNSFLNVLNDIYKFAKKQLEYKDISYYNSFLKYETPSIQHKSVRISNEFNEFLNSHATKENSAKFLLSAMIQDYIKSNK